MNGIEAVSSIRSSLFGGCLEPTQVRLTIPDTIDPTLILGPADVLLRRIEETFDVLITVRGNTISVMGPAHMVERVTTVISRLIVVVESGEVPSMADLEMLMGEAANSMRPVSSRGGLEAILVHQGRAILPKTEGQQRYVEAIRSHTITFGLGPAGTGKTYLAMAMAISALRHHEVSRIVLTRPVVEAGESLGFLPGTLQEKLDPYIRPLYDALFDMCDRERGNAYLEQGIIEIAPLAFMRGRTLNNSFVILDEAQNTTPDQMKMFLTRLGFGSRFVVTGDVTQRDMRGTTGIDDARRVLSHIDGIAFVELNTEDVVRHSSVAEIVNAYRMEDGL